MLGERHRDGDALAVGQHRQIVLLAIAEAIAGCRYAAYEQRLRAVGAAVEGHSCRRPGLNGKALRAAQHHGLGLGVYQFHARRSANAPFRRVDNARGDACLVAHADKARHVGLHHHVFTGHGLATDGAREHVFCVGHTDETPCCEALGQRELQCHPALGVGLEGRIEERGLVEVLAHLYPGRSPAATGRGA